MLLTLSCLHQRWNQRPPHCRHLLRHKLEVVVGVGCPIIVCQGQGELAAPQATAQGKGHQVEYLLLTSPLWEQNTAEYCPARVKGFQQQAVK